MVLGDEVLRIYSGGLSDYFEKVLGNGKHARCKASALGA